MVGVIRRWMLFHPKLREVYGPLGYLPNDKNWGTAASLRFPLRTANYMEDTIEAVGADQQITSRHYDEIIGDDLVNKETANTPEQLANTEKWWGLTKGLLVTGGIRILIGTRWHFYDIYGATIRKEEERAQRGDKPRVHICRLQPRIPREDGSYDQTCQPRFKHKTEEKLREDLEDLGPTLYAGQIDLEPLPEGTALIKESDLRKAFYRLDHVMERDHENRLRVKAGFDVAITCDLAASLDPKADRTAILVTATDMDGDIYLVDAAVGRMMPSEAVARIASFRNRYGALWLGTEVGVLKAIYKSSLIEWSRDHPGQRPLFFTEIETGGGKGTKRDRCLAIEPYVLAGKIHLLASQVDILQELCMYPIGRYDDVVDALAFRVLNPRRPNQKRRKDSERTLTTQEKCHAIAMRGNREMEYVRD
jgi:predicted phage terminase large subunit-like protein